MTDRKTQNILFTRNLTDKHRLFGKKMNLIIDDFPFIQIDVNRLSDETINSISSDKNALWIFTSQNAVKSVVNSISDFSHYQDKVCFAVGEKTAVELRKHGFNVRVPENHNSNSLVDLLEKESFKNTYIYFTGNLRRNTITHFLEENDINFTEVECYRTNLIQPDINISKYKAIAFCSPSAVISFFKKYHLNETIPCIAIGSTTAVKLLDYTENVVMSENANIYSMIEICKEYLYL